jgi:Tol biopolymer transport system component
LAWPTFLPDGRRFVFLGRSSERAKSALFLASLDAPGRTHLVDVLSSVEYANGHLFYHRDGTLYAHPFDANAGRLTGAALPVVKDIRYNAENGRGAFSVSSTVLAYVTGTNIIGSPNRSILRFDQFGNQVGSVGAIGAFDRAALSPDGRRLVVEEQSQDAHQVGTLRLMDVDRGLPTRFTVGAVDEFHPVWTPNGSAIVFGSTRPNASGIYRRAAGGGATTDELLFASAEPAMPTGFSPDGKTLLFQRGAPSRSRIEALMVPDPQAAAPAQGAKTIVVFPGSTTPDSDAVFSPDSKWIAYTSGDDVNSSQIYVQPYPADGRRIRISETAGRAPRWTLDGKQIIYRTSQDDITSVPLTMVDGAPQPGAPKKLFNQRRQGRFLFDFSVDRRGEHFVLIVPPPATTTEEQSPIKVILNWAARVAKR